MSEPVRGNLFAPAERRADGEVFETLAADGSCRVERIVSTGQMTPAGEWYDQELDEWVALLSGSATLRLEERREPIELVPGDWVVIPAHCRHRVERTDPDQPTVWVAVHFSP